MESGERVQAMWVLSLCLLGWAVCEARSGEKSQPNRSKPIRMHMYQYACTFLFNFISSIVKDKEGYLVGGSQDCLVREGGVGYNVKRGGEESIEISRTGGKNHQNPECMVRYCASECNT